MSSRLQRAKEVFEQTMAEGYDGTPWEPPYDAAEMPGRAMRGAFNVVDRYITVGMNAMAIGEAAARAAGVLIGVPADKAKDEQQK